MRKNKEITDKLAVQILDSDIERCKKVLSTLETRTDDYNNVYMEMRSYQMHKKTLLKGGGANDR